MGSSLGGLAPDVQRQLLALAWPLPAGLRAFAAVCQVARPSLLAVLTAQSADEIWASREAIARAVAHLAPASDEAAVVALLVAQCDDGDAKVRSSALAALAKVALPGNTVAETAASRCLADGSPQVVCAAAAAVSSLAPPGCPAALRAIAACLRGEAWAVRRAAVDAISRIAEGDALAVELLALALEDGDRWIRVAALTALAEVAPRGDSAALALAVDRLGDESWNVRAAALDAVASLAPRGDEDAVGAAAALLDDAYPSVRITALGALAGMRPRGDRDTLAAMLACMERDPDADVRMEAIEATVRTAFTGDERVIEALRERASEDLSQEVRAAAELAAEQM